MSRLYTRKNIIISFIIIAVVVLLFAFFTYRSNREGLRQTHHVKESQQSMQVIEDLMDDLQDIETGQRGFLITRTPYFLEPYSNALKKIPADTQAVRDLISLYPQRRGMISQLLGSTRRKIDQSTAIVDLIRAGKYDSAQRAVFSGVGKQVMDSIRRITDLILKQDRVFFLKSDLKRQQAVRNSAILLISLLSLSLGVLSWLLWQYFIGEAVRRDNREKLHYLARLTEQAGDAIFSTSLSGLILSWNSGAEKLFGYKKEQVMGKFNPGIKLGGVSLDKINELAGQGIQNEPIKIEGFHIPPGKNGFDYSASITTLSNENNERTGFLVVLRDITGQKRAEKVLFRFNEELTLQVEEKTALVRNIVGRIRDGFYSLDNEWRFTYVNEYMYELTGKTPGELMGHSILEAFPEVVNTPAYEALTFAVREQKQHAIDFFFPPLGKWFSSQLYPSPTGISVFFRDVSEVKNAEMEIRRSNERFDLISRTTRDAIWEWNCETGEMWGNEVHQQLYGLTMADPAPSEKEWQNRLHPDDRERIINEQEKALASDTNVFITEYRFRTDFNGYRDIYSRCYIVRNAEGKATRLLGNMMDITERKKAESALKESEEKLRHILASSADDFYVIDLDYRVIMINQTAQRNLELAWGEKVTTGTYILDLLPPERKDFIRNNYDLVFKGEVVNYDIPVPFQDGVLWKNVEYGPVRNEEGVITGAFVTSVDITAKKNAEEDILKSNARFQTVSKATSDIVWDIDVLAQRIWLNDNYYQNLGYDRTDETRALDEWFSLIHPDDMQRVRTKYSDAITGTVSSWRDEYRYLRSDGTYLNMLDRGFIMRDESNQAYRMIGSMVDMTPVYQVQRKIVESENRLRMILDTDPECINLFDKDVRILGINRAGRTLIEAEEVGDLKGYDFKALVERQQQGQVAELIRKGFEGESGRFEFGMITLKGNKRWCEMNTVPFRDAEGAIIQVLAVTRDISEKKKAEEELLQSYRAIRELSGHLQNIREDERSHIAREIHDELGQQMTVLKMDISWLVRKWEGKDEKVTERLSGLLEMIDKTVKSVRRISSELRPSMLDDLGLAAAIEWHSQDFGKRMGIGIRTQVETGEVKLTDRVNISLFRVLQECLTNVARHAKATEVTVRLYQQDDLLNLEVQDNGVGFVKAEVENKKTLGILGMKERVALIKGDYRIDSTPGKGTLVRVTVPVSPTT